MKIKHIFFDLDHTLWDFDRNSELTFRELFTEFNISITTQDFLKVYMPINFEYWKKFREEKVSKKELQYGRLKDTFDSLNYKISDPLINKISEEYINYLPNNNYLIEGTLDLLKYLAPTYKLHIITNGFEKVQRLKLEKSGIKKYFDKIITSESVGVKKPNAKIFEFALNITNAKIEESIMIGDSYEADVLGALEFGMLAIHCNFLNDNSSKGLVSVTSLNQIKQYI